MVTKIDYQQSVMMDKVLKEIKNIISTLVVKLKFIADRYETDEIRQYADEYISAVRMEDNFYTYKYYSDYALIKAGVDVSYKYNTETIPYEYRDTLVVYQREYTIMNYEERNSYYRTLNGLPDTISDYVYITEVTTDLIDGVDATKPLHLMDINEITILEVMGYMSQIKLLHPDKKYLDHLSTKKIDIVTARMANDYSILYIYSDRTKQPVAEMFISIYNNNRTYVLDRFYDRAYEFESEYYAGYMGLFMLSITTQRFITNYFHKFINRDFYDKDIIKLLFTSYGLPFYNEIPLAYLQKIAKNLNRLLMYKSTDRVFTDIFKIFDMDNVEVCNYILFKNPIMDKNNKPVLIYKEKTELGYDIETKSYLLTNTDDFYGVVNMPFNNVKKIEEIFDGTNYMKVILLNNGIVTFVENETVFKSSYYQAIVDGVSIINDDGYLQLNDYFNFTDLKRIKEVDGSDSIYLLCKSPYIVYKLTKNKIETIDIRTLLNITDKKIFSISIKQDITTLNEMIIINYETSSEAYMKLSNGTSYSKIGSMDETVINADYNDNAAVTIMSSGKLYIYGDNKNYRMLNKDSLMLASFTEMNDQAFKSIDVKIMSEGIVLIVKDGTVRYTRTVPELGNEEADYDDTILADYSNVKGIFELFDGGRIIYCLMTYTGNMIPLNYSYSDLYGELLFDSNIDNPSCYYKFIKNITCVHDGILITTYGYTSTIGYSGTNENSNFPFITTLSMVTENNNMNIEFVQIYKGFMFFTTTDSKFMVYKGHSTTDLTSKIGSEKIQNLINTDEELFILVGKSYMYMIKGTTNEDMSIEKINMIDNKIIVDVIKDGKDYSDLIVKCSDGSYYKYMINTFISVQFYNCYHKLNDIEATVKPYDDSGTIKYKLDVSISGIDYSGIDIKSPNNIVRVTICDKVLFLEGEKIYYIKLSNIDETTTEVEANVHEALSAKRAKSVRINDNLIIYNKAGGISILRNFIHADRLDTQISSDYVSILDSSTSKVTDVIFDNNNIIKLENTSKYVTYEPEVKDMYKLSFVEIPMDAANKAEYLADTSHHLNYDLVVSDDTLWGGSRDHDEFLKSVLSSEYNYVTSKYISINSTYDLTKLNFEVCYMFKMLSELKDSEKYLNIPIKYVGDTPLFEAVVALFALTCKKFGLEGNILDTTTKKLSVLGFNFSLDMTYIEKVVKDAKLYKRDSKFKLSDIEILKNPKLFANSAEVINLYLDNENILQNIYDYKFNAKTIQEYNAYKRIEQASLYSSYYNEIYKVGDVMADTYLDYIRRVNPKLYKLVNDATDESILEVMDYILLALTEFADPQKFKYLFFNIPTISLDLIMRFIYYLIDMFKSYTVDLKAMNIIYHIDDKRLSNIKLILSEDNFIKKWNWDDKNAMIDYIHYLLNTFKSSDHIKLIYKSIMESNLNYDEITGWFKVFHILENVVEDKLESLFEDYADFFDDMQATWTYKNNNKDKGEIMGYVLKNIIHGLLVPKETLNVRKKIVLSSNNEISDKIIEKELYKIMNTIEFDKAVLMKVLDNITSNGIFDNKDIIKYTDYISTLEYHKEFKDEIIGDFAESTNLTSSLTRSDKSIKLKDKYYFIRNE